MRLLPRSLFTRWIIPLLGLGMFLFAVKSLASQETRQDYLPQRPPSFRAFEQQVMGVGVIEPQSETVAIAPFEVGVIESVAVKAGERVEKGATLFVLDQRLAMAEQERLAAEVGISEAMRQDSRAELTRLQGLTKGLAVGESRLERQQYALKIADATVQAKKAALKEANTRLELLTIRAPLSGTILQVNVRAGEFASTGHLTKPLLQMGNIDAWHLRAEFDETQAHLITPTAKAVANPRGNPESRIPLTFVRFEPQAVAKLSLTGDKTERVDTRVIQVLYRLPEKTPALFSGQQMDVFVESGRVP
jgi:HlyD family secretion protein